LLDDIVAKIDADLGLRFAFFGHSMGALVCFELARKLRRERGVEPSHIFVSAAPAPRLGWLGSSPPLSTLSDPQLFEHVWLRAGVPTLAKRKQSFIARALPRLLPRLRADLTVLESYRYAAEGPLSCPITVFGGWNDPLVTVEALEAWRRETTSAFHLFMLPAGHFFIEAERREIARRMADTLR
jgi:medium-chain acyl-[acyl-carrier-protein] hydrolase